MNIRIELVVAVICDKSETVYEVLFGDSDDDDHGM